MAIEAALIGARGGGGGDAGGGEALQLATDLLRTYRPLYQHHPSRVTFVLSLLLSLPPHPHGPPPATRLALLSLCCPACSPVCGGIDANASPPPTQPPRRRGALYGCSRHFSRYAAPAFGSEDAAAAAASSSRWARAPLPAGGEGSGEGRVGGGSHARAQGAVAEAESAWICAARPRPSAASPAQQAEQAASSFAAELLRATLGRLAAAQAGPAVSVLEACFELTSPAQRALFSARLELAAAPVPPGLLGGALARAALSYSHGGQPGAASALAAAGSGGEPQAACLLAGWLGAHCRAETRSAMRAAALAPLSAAVRARGAPGGAAAGGAGACVGACEGGENALFLVDGLWRSSSPLVAGEEAASLVAQLEADAQAASPASAASLSLSLSLSLSATAPVLQRCAAPGGGAPARSASNPLACPACPLSGWRRQRLRPWARWARSSQRWRFAPSTALAPLS